jgi:hypothetical protein
MNRSAVVGHCTNPIVGLRQFDMRHCPAGVSIAELAPTGPGALVCRINGEWVSREHWADRVAPGDVIEFYSFPRNRDTLRTGLQIAAFVAANAIAPGSGLGAVLARTAFVLAANLAINRLLPPSELAAAGGGPQQTGNGFAAALSGNQARLDAPIWKTCGFDEITPPFAAEPYSVFLPANIGDSDADPDLDRDQYLYALYCVGIGTHEVVAKIGNTPLSRFDDVLVATYLPPGTAPSQVLANVQTAGEVAGQELPSGVYVGGFAANRPLSTASSIGIDIVAPRGLGKTGSLTVEWQVEVRAIDDFGRALSAWEVLANESRTAFTSSPQRWSEEYALSEPVRCEVRIVRTDVQDTDPAALHEIAWAGLRAYLAEAAPLNQEAAHFELVMRASAQLSALSSRDVRLIVKGYARSWDSSGWVDAAFTRNPAWHLLDLATSSAWGLGEPDERIDVESFEDLAVTCEARQDRFDFTFDSSSDAWEAMQLIARAARARVFRRNGILTVARDGAVDAPVTAFSPRNCLAGSIRIVERLPQTDDPDGVIVEYRDHRSRQWTEIVCPLPGLEESDVSNPVLLRLPGVIGATHAEREGRYEAARMLYRTRTAEWTTEAHGMLPTVLSPVMLAADVPSYAQAGDVVGWDGAGLIVTLSSPVENASETPTIWFVRDDGTINGPIDCTPGPAASDVVLATPPDFTLTTEVGTRERTRYLLGAAATVDTVRIASISGAGDADGARLFALAGVVDDARVHTADADLLPGEGEIQDPIATPDGDDEGDSSLVLANLTNHLLEARWTSGGNYTVEELYVEITFANDGSFSYEIDGPGYSPITGSFENEWSRFGLIDAGEAAGFDIRFEIAVDGDVLNYGALSGAAFNSWHSLGTSRTVHYGRNPTVGILEDPGVYKQVRVKIRDASTLIVQATAIVTLYLIGPWPSP